MTAPTGPFFYVEIDTAQVQATLQTLMQRLEFGIPVWMRTDLTDFLRERASDRFAMQGDDASGPWAPLQPATESMRASLGYPPSRPINIRTYELYNYIMADRGSVNYSAGWTLNWPNPPGDAETYEKLRTAQRGKPSPNTTDRPVVALGVGDYDNIMVSLAVFITAGLL